MDRTMSKDDAKQNDEVPTFAIFAETKTQERPLIQLDLTFGRLMDDIVVPYDSNEPFFVDGVPLKRDNLRKLKIIRQTTFMKEQINKLHWVLREGRVPLMALPAKNYYLRIEGLLRETGEDVTSQIIKAFGSEIKPRLNDYLPKRTEIISAAWKVFVSSMGTLGGLG